MSTLRIGILSTAKIARGQYIPAFKACDRAEVAGVASRSLEKAQAFADEMEIPRAFGSYEELINDPEIDAIYNPLPVSMHAEWSIKCAEAGKPVLCEKPLCANADEARRMVEAFEQHDVILAEALMFRFHPMTRKVKELIDDDFVGPVKLIRSNFTVKNDNPDDIRRKPETAGGSLLDLGVYCVSATRFFLGEEPEAVQGQAAWYHKNLVDDSFSGSLRFPSGAIGYFGCSLSAVYDCAYDIVGPKGRILVDNGAMVAGPGKPRTIKLFNADGASTIEIPPVNHYQLMAQDFVDAVLDQRPVTYSPRDSIANMSVIDQLLADARR